VKKESEANEKSELLRTTQETSKLYSKGEEERKIILYEAQNRDEEDGDAADKDPTACTQRGSKIYLGENVEASAQKSHPPDPRSISIAHGLCPQNSALV
jgi:hypothetical protein